MMKPKKRQILIISGIVILIGAIYITSSFFRRERKESRESEITARPVVPVFKANPKKITSYITFTGRVHPTDRIQIHAEVGGVLQLAGKPFKTGVHFQEGDVLAKIVDTVNFQNLKAQKSSFQNTLSRLVPNISIDYPDKYEAWKKYLDNFNINEALPELPDVKDEPFKLYLTGNNIYTQFYNIKQLETRYSKQNMYAPFNGTLTQTSVNEGTMVRVGQNLGEFTKTGPLELETSVSSNGIQYIDIEDVVEMYTNDGSTIYSGRIQRVNEKIDPATQTVKIFIKILNHNGNLKPGSYLSGKVPAQTFANAMKIDNRILVQNNHLYIVQDSIATLQPVDILSRSIDSVIINGLEKGTTIINEKKDLSFEGTKVNIE